MEILQQVILELENPNKWAEATLPIYPTEEDNPNGMITQARKRLKLKLYKASTAWAVRFIPSFAVCTLAVDN